MLDWLRQGVGHISQARMVTGNLVQSGPRKVMTDLQGGTEELRFREPGKVKEKIGNLVPSGQRKAMSDPRGEIGMRTKLTGQGKIKERTPIRTEDQGFLIEVLQQAGLEM